MEYKSGYLKILIVAGCRESKLPSGEEVVARDQAKLLSTGFNGQVDVCFIHQDRHKNVLLQLIDLCWSITAAKKVRTAILNFQPDIVHFHSIYPILSFSAVRAARKLGTKVAVTLHNNRFVCIEGAYFREGKSCSDCLKTSWLGVPRRCVQSSFLKSLILFLLNLWFVRLKVGIRWIDRFFSVSEFIAQQHHYAGVIPEQKSVVLKNRVSLQKKSTNFEKKTIVFTGRLSIQKGFLLFLEASNQLPEFQFVAVGHWDNSVPAFNSKSGNFTYIESLPHSELIFFLQENASLVLVPSICSESFSLIAHEALACGIPIITSEYGFLKTIVETSHAGISVDLEAEPNNLVDAISRLLGSKSLYETCSNSGYEYINKYFSEELFRERYYQVYQEMLN